MLQKTALYMMRSLSFFIPRNFLYKLKLKMVLKVWPKKTSYSLKIYIYSFQFQGSFLSCADFPLARWWKGLEIEIETLKEEEQYRINNNNNKFRIHTHTHTPFSVSCRASAKSVIFLFLFEKLDYTLDYYVKHVNRLTDGSECSRRGDRTCFACSPLQQTRAALGPATFEGNLAAISESKGASPEWKETLRPGYRALFPG